MTILGLHHITLVCTDAQRTIDFYTQILGLRLVKLTVNFDDPGAYHLYFGNQTGQPGSAITFFEWKHAKRGHPGIGGTHHLALQIPDRSGLLRWKRRLTDLGLHVTGPYHRHYFESIYFNDPDGVILEIATYGPGWTIDEPAEELGQHLLLPPQEKVVRNRDEAAIREDTWPEPVPTIDPGMALQHGMHHITAISSDIQRSQDFYSGLLGMRRVKMTTNFDDPTSAHWYWGDEHGRPGSIVTYFERSPAQEPRVVMGSGQTHHFALAVQDEDTQLEWRERLVSAGLNVTPVRDRIYFKSIYTRDPDGHILELATLGPGFMVDESEDELGSRLMLPPWLVASRKEIEANLQPVSQTEASHVA